MLPHSQALYMSALPCSNSLPWLVKGFTPVGAVTSTATFFSTPCSRSAHSTINPSFSKQAFVVRDQFRQSLKRGSGF